MVEVEFEYWWKDFAYNHEKDNDNGKSATNELKWTLKGFSENKRIAFIDKLIEYKHLDDACQLIPLFGNKRQKKFLRGKLIKRILLLKNNYLTEEIILAVLKTYETKDLILLKSYFHFNTRFDYEIMTLLYEIDRELFLSSFRKILRKTNIDYTLNINLLFDKNDIKQFLSSRLSQKELDKLEVFERKDNERFIRNR